MMTDSLSTTGKEEHLKIKTQLISSSVPTSPKQSNFRQNFTASYVLTASNEQQQQQQFNISHNCVPRSNTIPQQQFYYYQPYFYNHRHPIYLSNTIFQPISPHHCSYDTRPVDILKPTFLIVPKATEQRLTSAMPKKTPTKTKSSSNVSSPVQLMDIGHKYIGLVPTPNPSPYVHYATISHPRQSPAPDESTSPNEENQNRSTAQPADESSVRSVDLAHADPIDVQGSWGRFQSVPVRAGPRRHCRAPLPPAFLDQQNYASDSEQIVHPHSYRQPQLFSSIPTLDRPFDSIRSHNPFQFLPSLRLSEREILKIASFYKSIGTLVYVASSIATLYTSDFDAMANLKDWKKLYTGVPVWLFNTGMNPKRVRCIRLVIAELGSSFTLWDTLVNGASDVRLPKPRHITLKSLETGAILALKFDDTNSTDEFHEYFVKLSCDPRNSDLFDIFNPKRNQPVFMLRRRKVRKSAISKPTQFNHVTKVDEHDKDSLFTFSVLVDDAACVS